MTIMERLNQWDSHLDAWLKDLEELLGDDDENGSDK